MNRGIILSGLAAMAVTVAAPLHAETPVDQALLDCPLSELTKAEQEQAANQLASGEEDPAGKALIDRLVDKSMRCSKARGLPGTVGDNLFAYALSRLSQERLAAKVRAFGADPARIDAALGFGLGKANPEIVDELGDERMAAVWEAFKASGLDANAVTTEQWDLVQRYVRATSEMWKNSAVTRIEPVG